jgi:hypothetical protein
MRTITEKTQVQKNKHPITAHKRNQRKENNKSHKIKTARQKVVDLI